jgi:hypothetical protein
MLTASKSNQEHTVVFILQAIPYAFRSQSYEQEVREGIDNFGRVDCSIIILCMLLAIVLSSFTGESSLPSHQLMVDVTGAQYPSSLAGGYGTLKPFNILE